MQVVSVNVAAPEPITIGSRVATTGIFKQPALGLVAIGPEGLAGDTISDRVHHGGVDQAVYLYSADSYAWWASQLQRQVPYGTFGENLTVSSFGEGPLRIGDRLQFNTVLLEITFPRIPCATLAARVGDRDFVTQFIQARRPGAYARVIASGEAEAGEAVTLLPAPSAFPTVIDLYDLWHARERNLDLLRQALDAPISERGRATFETWLGQA
ncbi:MAG: MOSC domain-containing protein [Leptolyngbya sp.]|nr:MAG: MOSC domain-containing protein [Leptolyngbya sp.]